MCLQRGASLTGTPTMRGVVNDLGFYVYRRYCLVWGSQKCSWEHLFASFHKVPRLPPILASHTDFYTRSDELLWVYPRRAETKPHWGVGCPFMVKARLRNKFNELSTPRALQLAMCSCLPPTASSSVRLQQEQSEKLLLSGRSFLRTVIATLPPTPSTQTFSS